MADFATLPGGLYFGSERSDFVRADTDIPGGFDNLIHGFGGADTIFAGLGDDLVFGGYGNDWIFGDAGADTLHGEQGNDALNGGNGTDSIVGGGGNDTLDAGIDDDRVSGGTGNDFALGGDGNDRIAGDQGNDTLTGGNGNDFLAGGADRDDLTGGAGRDVFHFESGFGRDVVLDFRAGEDMLEIQSGINGTGITTLSQLASHISIDKTGAVITLGGDQIKLVGISADDLISHLDAYVKIV